MTQKVDVQLDAGDRIVFLGDSITQAGSRPGGYVDLLRESIARFSGPSGVEVIASGISGDRVPNCLARLEGDVLSHRPAWVVVYAGVNDVWHSTRGEGTDAEEFRESLHEIVNRCQDHGARVCLATVGLIGEKTDGSNSFDAQLDAYSDIVREVADLSDSYLVDLRIELLSHLRKINPGGRPHSIITTDGVHLNALGNQFVAAVFGRFFGFDEDAADSKILRHIVLFRFRPETTVATKARLDHSFMQLKSKIPEVISIEAGTNNSPEGLSDGFTHGYVVTFRSENDRAVYLPHPEHQKFVTLVKPHLEKALVFDFMADADQGIDPSVNSFGGTSS